MLSLINFFSNSTAPVSSNVLRPITYINHLHFKLICTCTAKRRSNKHDTNCGRKLFNNTHQPLIISGIKTFTSIHEQLKNGGRLMQVHTVNLIFPLGHEDVYNMESTHSIKFSQVNDYFSSIYPYARFSIYRTPIGRPYLSLIIDCMKLLNKSDMVDEDYLKLERNIKQILMDIFGHINHFDFHTLKEIDYKIDTIVENEKHREQLFKLYNKLTKSFRFQKFKNGHTTDNKEFNIYMTTIYHLSDAIIVRCYDKEQERIDKGEPVLPHEMGVMIFEIAVKQKHIYYRSDKKHCPDPIDRKLKEWFKEEIWEQYFSYYLSPIYKSGDFYKLSKARSIINSSTLNPSMKTKLIEFLKTISRGDLDTPLKKGMNRKTYNSRIKRLEKLGINPILIPENTKDVPNILTNPLKDFFPLIKQNPNRAIPNDEEYIEELDLPF